MKTLKPRPNRLGMYADVREVLDAALASGGGSYALATDGAAIHWRQRAYRFRKMFAEGLPPHELSPYDALMMPKIVEGSATVVIKMQAPRGTFVPNFAPADIPATDDLLDEALALAEKLEKGNG